MGLRLFMHDKVCATRHMKKKKVGRHAIAASGLCSHLWSSSLAAGKAKFFPYDTAARGFGIHFLVFFP